MQARAIYKKADMVLRRVIIPGNLIEQIIHFIDFSINKSGHKTFSNGNKKTSGISGGFFI